MNESKNKIQRLEVEIVHKDAVVPERENYIAKIEASAIELEDKI